MIYSHPVTVVLFYGKACENEVKESLSGLSIMPLY